VRRPHRIVLPLLLTGCGPASNPESDAAARLCAPALPAVRDRYSDAEVGALRQFRQSPLGTVAFSDNSPPTNRITNPGAALGRVLFYDVRLSRNDRIACASCHRQAFGFGDTARFSTGHLGRPLARHTMALANARFNAAGRFFWDQRAPSLEAQVLQPVGDSMEMGLEPEALERKLAATPFYPALFTSAFGSPEITRDRVAAALAQFVRSLVSARSRLDAVYATGTAPDSTLLTASEREGLRLFTTIGCINCHRTIAFFADKASNNGLDSMPADTGAGGGQFKPPSLRNVAVRPPYMHDGRLPTLRQVVEFYDHGVRNSPALDPRLRARDGEPRRLHLSPTQMDALVAFMEALTDSTFLRDVRFSDPFPCGSLAGRTPPGSPPPATSAP
jgi:cytochrome c peroxidase